MRRRHRRLRRRRRRGRRGPRRGRARRDRPRGRLPLQPRQLPGRPARRDRLDLPRRRPDHRRGEPGDPGAGRKDGRRDDGDQLGNLLPGPRAGPQALARGPRGRVGERPRSRLRRGRGVPARAPARPRADGPQRPAGDGGGRGDGRQRRPDLPQRRLLRPVQLLPLRLPDRRQARDARQLPAAGGRRRGPAAGRGRGAPGPGRGRARRRASAAAVASAGNGRPAPTRSAPGWRRSSPAARSGRRSC